MTGRTDLDHFFKPKSVAVIGASREPRKFGHVIFKNFLESEFEGEAYPVNPKTDNIMGYKAYKSVRDISSELDLAIIAIPASAVPSAIDECVSKQVKAAIIVSGGFREIGEKGLRLENEIKKKMENSNIRIIGPNCIGVYDPVNHVDTLFLPRYRLRRPKRGPIGFISQSGAFGSAVLDWAASQEIGISKFISIGNKIDVDEVDLLEYLVDDSLTKCVTIYSESISRGREFLEVSSKLAKNKPLIALKGGVTDEEPGGSITYRLTGRISKNLCRSFPTSWCSASADR